jgi:hypothetical protein
MNSVLARMRGRIVLISLCENNWAAPPLMFRWAAAMGDRADVEV